MKVCKYYQILRENLAKYFKCNFTYIWMALKWCLILEEFLFISVFKLGAFNRWRTALFLFPLSSGWILSLSLRATRRALFIWARPSGKVWKNWACTTKSLSVMVIVCISKNMSLMFPRAISYEGYRSPTVTEVDVLQELRGEVPSVRVSPYEAITDVIWWVGPVVRPWKLQRCRYLALFH